MFHFVTRTLLAAAAFVLCALRVAVLADDPRGIPLVDQRGEPFTLADLRGRPTLVTFVATRCSDVCPLANMAYASLARRLRADRVRARLLTITLDPDYDTPFVMARLARAFAAAPGNWTFASGRPADVRRLMRSFGVVADSNGKGKVPEVHTSFAYVLDPAVRLARTMLLSTNLAKDAEPVLSALSKR